MINKQYRVVKCMNTWRVTIRRLLSILQDQNTRSGNQNTMGWKLNDDTVKTKSTAIPMSSLVYLTNVRERERSMTREWITLWPVGPKTGFAWVTERQEKNKRHNNQGI